MIRPAIGHVSTFDPYPITSRRPVVWYRIARQQTRQAAMYTASTRSITVTVNPSYLEEESTPAENEFRWAYHVRIENHGSGTVKLLSRYWRITDAFGRVQEVRGPGVVGEQPELQPGHAFEYQSWTPLHTPSGIMVGLYQMEERRSGELFDVDIPAFSLDSPYQPVRLN